MRRTLPLPLQVEQGVFDNLSLAAALRAGDSGAHLHPHEILNHLFLTGAVALGTGFNVTVGAAGSVADCAVFNPGSADLLVAAESRFLKTDGNRGPDRFPTHRAVAPGLPAAEPAAEETAENITQIAEIEIAGETAAIAARTTVIGIDAGKAELIILRLFVRIA